MMVLPSARQVARAVRWLNRSGGLGLVPREAGDLLAVRLAARQRMVLRSIPVVIGLFAMLVVVFVLEDSWLAEGLPLGELERRHVLGAVAFVGLLTAFRALMQVFMNRADRRILAALPRSVGRVGVPSVTVVLGRFRTASLVVTGVLLAARVAAGWATEPAPHAVTVTLLLLVCLGFSGVNVAMVLHRPTVAVDVASLAIDERLRSEEAFGGAVPIFLALFVVSGFGSGSGAGPGPGPWLWESLWVLTLIGPAVMLFLASFRPPWSGRRPEGWAAPIRVGDGGLS